MPTLYDVFLYGFFGGLGLAVALGLLGGGWWLFCRLIDNDQQP